ncbi:MAG TPA: dienelactone hydrolase family protein [Nitrososphaeraceae archaeon]|jgi:putative phosphoribosyl transferase|nr:dienelactone hydrolase family protein [Nitrososphaeraceae archaeon]
MTSTDSKNPQHQEIVSIEDDNQNIIEGNLSIPFSSTTANKDIKGIVIIAHGSGSSRHSPRNRYVAQVLNDDGIATLLIDLLTSEEEKIDSVTREHRFNIKLLAKRLLSATDWILQSSRYKSLRLGYFGASTGAAAALVAAAERASKIYAIVSRGGRPDLAGSDVLNCIDAPTLFLVGENDKQIIELNEMALKQLSKIEKKKKMIIVPRATHLFEEPGALEEVARRASGWFQCFFLEEKHSI